MHSELVRQRIQTTQLVNRLTNFALGKLKKPMEPHQVSAALGILRKTLPDLAAVAHSGTIEVEATKLENLTDAEISAGIALLRARLASGTGAGGVAPVQRDTLN
jgi:hypothetical protein